MPTPNNFSNKKFFLITIALLLFMAILISPIYYAQTQGVCLKYGRVLSDEEIRKLALLNLIKAYVQQFAVPRDSGNEMSDVDSYYSWVGINSPAQEMDLQKLVESSFLNGKTFEENFGLKMLLKGYYTTQDYKKLNLDSIEDPFFFIVYSMGGKKSAMFFNSTEFKKIEFKGLKAYDGGPIRHKANFFEKLWGYGNHYYNFGTPPFHYFSNSCCDNKLKESDEEYQKLKKSGFESTIHSFREGTLQDQHIGMVSNCGAMPYFDTHLGIDELWPESD